MAESALMPFSDTDEFLRRVRFKDHIKWNREEVRWKAFKDRDDRMSFTHRNSSLQSDAAIEEYHTYYNKLVGETLPAILRFTFCGLTKVLNPPLEPERDPDSEDTKYGHLHCSTPRPRDKPHMEFLAKLVNDGKHAGIISLSR